MIREVVERADGADLGMAGRTLSWLVASIGVVLFTLFVVGIGRVTRLLSTADPGIVLSVVVVVLGLTVVRGVGLWVVLSIHDVRVSLPRSVAVYFAASFVNTVTPSGQAAGAPVSGLLIARAERIDYEVGFASILSVDALGNLVLFSFGVVGAGWLVVTATVGRGFTVVALAGAATFAFFLSGLVATWVFRDRVLEVVTDSVAALVGMLDRILPERFVPDRQSVERRVKRFGRALGRLVEHPRRLAVLLVILASAHLLSVFALWLSFAAVGGSVGFLVLVAVIPTAVLAAIVPLPGGTGGIDVALIALLATTTGAAAPVVGAAVVLYRTATSGMRVLVGGSLTAAVFAFRR